MKDALAWMTDAACLGKPTEWFFPAEGAHVPNKVRKLCLGCPVRMECLEFGLRLPRGSDGIYGGLTERERERLRRVRRNNRDSRVFSAAGWSA